MKGRSQQIISIEKSDLRAKIWVTESEGREESESVGCHPRTFTQKACPYLRSSSPEEEGEPYRGDLVIGPNTNTQEGTRLGSLVLVEQRV